MELALLSELRTRPQPGIWRFGNSNGHMDPLSNAKLDYCRNEGIIITADRRLLKFTCAPTYVDSLGSCPEGHYGACPWVMRRQDDFKFSNHEMFDPYRAGIRVPGNLLLLLEKDHGHRPA